MDHENCEIGFGFLLVLEFFEHPYNIVKFDPWGHYRVWAATPKCIGYRRLIVQRCRIERCRRKNNIGLGRPDGVYAIEENLWVVVSLAMVNQTALIVTDLNGPNR